MRPLRTAIISLCALTLISHGFAAQPAAEELRRQTFQTVWERVRDRFYDPMLGGVDWQAVHERYAPLVDAAKTNDELYALLNRMLGELKQSHFAVIPPAIYQGEEDVLRKGRSKIADPTAPRFGRAWAGMTVQVVEGQPVVTRVESGSSAARAGIRPGYVVTRIGDVSLPSVWATLKKRADRDAMRRFRLSQMAQALSTGEVGDVVKIQYVDARDRARTAACRLQLPKGTPVKFGELPVIYSRVEQRWLRSNVGYVRFNIFLLPLLQEIKDAIAGMSGASAIIVDLRGNPGGVGLMAVPIAAMFYSHRTSLGVTRMREGEINYLVNPSADPVRCKLVFLTDETTASTAEILAGGMQETGRAVVVGSNSLGAVLPSVIEKLPIGARLQYAFADFRTPKGILLEGRGVGPDVPVVLSRRGMLKDRDVVVTAALRYVSQHSRPRSGRAR